MEQATSTKMIVERILKDFGVDHNEIPDNWEWADWYSGRVTYHEIVEEGFISANWNHTPDGLFEALEEALGWDNLDWCDQVTSCGSCCAAIRTEPTSYVWLPLYLSTDYGYVCKHCFQKDPEEFFDDYINNSDKAFTHDMIDGLELYKYGFEQYSNRHQSGFFGGMDDDPKKILEDIHQRADEELEVIFVISENSQFYLTFETWVREKGWDDDE